ncbi:16S rRNA (adenine(1518)-N(6)/adenine(1519)-N(6))-dimethyltransferase RsmA [Petrocella sp. FN5]|nr:16S rRNA (adenine(1518)-N(6)/adenine(1519)-N(6))-dimethyltransferase RsmA [Petrocella sp. FN5]MDF1617432.1 16S rRNA (adenine(1518)-N(6)/adenine(1519)-N(6))-dimethyltransferase RsmA [Petrocella sp. FN5]
MIKRIANISETKAIIEKYGFSFQKRFGQNFLIDSNIIDKIIQGASLTKEDVVLEIGPGIGSLTQAMAESAKKVIAVEIDKKLIPVLEDTLSGYDNIRIINEDILKLDIKKLISEEGVNRIKVVANLPYYITTPIIMNLLEKRLPITSITVMIQKEVAERMDAVPGTKAYGALSLATSYYAQTELVTMVKPDCFIPRPNVGSAVIKLTRRTTPSVSVIDEAILFKIIKGGFAQRRKTLINSLTNSQPQFNKSQVIQVLETLDLDVRIRGEALNLNQYAQITNKLIKLADLDTKKPSLK